MTQVNQGIIVTGGSFNSNQVAVGAATLAIQNSYELVRDFKAEGCKDLAKSLEALIASLETHCLQIKDYEEVTQAVQMIAEEVKKKNPNKFTLRGLLQGVRESVGSVVDIVDKLGLLQKAISALIGMPLP
jgi:hypothetical protein